ALHLPPPAAPRSWPRWRRARAHGRPRAPERQARPSPAARCRAPRAAHALWLRPWTLQPLRFRLARAQFCVALPFVPSAGSRVAGGTPAVTKARRMGFFKPRSAPAQDHIVAMDQRGAAGKAQDGGDLARPFADDALGVLARIGDEPAAELAAVGGADDHRVTPLEGAPHTRHARGQEA